VLNRHFCLQVVNGQIYVKVIADNLQCSPTLIIILNTDHSDIAMISEMDEVGTSNMTNSFIYTYFLVPWVSSPESGFPAISGHIECPSQQYVSINFSFSIESLPPIPSLLDMFPLRAAPDQLSSRTNLNIDISYANEFTARARLARQNIRLSFREFGVPVTLLRKNYPLYGEAASLTLTAPLPDIWLQSSTGLMVQYHNPVV